MKAQVNDKIRIVNKMSDWCMDYKEGDIFTVESTWYGGVNVTSKTGVPLSIDEVEYEMIGQEKAPEALVEDWKVMLHADSTDGLERAMKDAGELLKACEEKGIPADIELLANGQAVKGLQAELDENGNIGKLYGQGVKFFACEKSMEELGIGKESLVSGVKTVSSAAVELVQKQVQGFAYIKA